MADGPRLTLAEEIAECIRDEQMLGTLAQAAKAQKITGKKVYRDDAVLTLQRAQVVMRRYRENLEHVRAVYDGLVEGMPDG